MKKLFSIILKISHIIFLLCLISILGYSIFQEKADSYLNSVFAVDSETPVDTSDSFRDDSDADNIRLYIVSPLNPGGSYDSEIEVPYSNYETGELGEASSSRTVRLYTEIAKKYGLCRPTGNFSSWMTRCQREQPEDLAVLMHFVKVHLAKLKEDRDLILAMNRERANSKKQADRFAAAFFNTCVQLGLSGELSRFSPESGSGTDSLGAMDLVDLCNRAKNLSSSEKYKIAAKVMGLPDDYLGPTGDFVYFDYHDFVFDYIARKSDKDSDKYFKGSLNVSSTKSEGVQSSSGSTGMMFLRSLMPDFDIWFDPDGDKLQFDVSFYAPDMEPAQAFLAIYSMIDDFLNSEGFNNLETDGCIPSLFSKTESSNDKKSYSVCLPTKIIEEVNGLPLEDAKYLRAKIARKVAILLTVEMLRGGVILADETAKILRSANDEIAQYADANAKYMRNLAEAYSSLLDVTFATRLEDILNEVYYLAVAYSKEVKSVETGTQQIGSHIAQAALLGISN